jgi:hypothetical protein
MKREIAMLAGPRGWGDTRESWLARVPEKVPGLSLRIVKGLWYGEIDDKHWAAIEIRNAVEIIETQRELQKLMERQKIVIERLRVIDEAFHSQEIARHLDVVCRLGNKNRP